MPRLVVTRSTAIMFNLRTASPRSEPVVGEVPTQSGPGLHVLIAFACSIGAGGQASPSAAFSAGMTVEP